MMDGFFAALESGNDDSSSSETDEDYSERAQALLRAYGNYSERLLAELTKRGFGVKSLDRRPDWPALAPAAMSATRSGGQQQARTTSTPSAARQAPARWIGW